MKMQGLCWLAVPLLAGTVSYFAATGQLRRAWPAVLKSDPVIDYPADLDLGTHEIGEQVVGHFSIANRGGRELVVDQIRTNCSCTGMEREEDGHYVRVDSLRLKRGQQAQLSIRVSVRGVPVGRDMANVIQFQTNDPTQPIGRINAVVRHVSGGVSAIPGSIVFGRVPVGTLVKQVVDVRDTAARPRVIERVTTNSPDRVTLRLVPVEDAGAPTAPHPDGVLIGRIEVRVDTAIAGEVDAMAQIYLAGETRNPDAVAVRGQVARQCQLIPSSVILPRASNTGPVYSATCICRTMSDRAVTLTVEHLPLGFKADILAQDGCRSPTVQITCDPTRVIVPMEGQRHIIRFRAKTGEYESVLELPVLLQM